MNRSILNVPVGTPANMISLSFEKTTDIALPDSGNAYKVFVGDEHIGYIAYRRYGRYYWLTADARRLDNAVYDDVAEGYGQAAKRLAQWWHATKPATVVEPVIS